MEHIMAYSLGIIGGGNMGTPIARGAVDHDVIPAEKIIVCDIDEAKRAAAEAIGCAVTDDPAEAACAEQILLAVKPQVVPCVAERIAPLPDGKVVISIMAGLTSANLRSALGPSARIVRVMPNLPSQIGAGMAAIALGEGALKGDDELATSLFAAIGRTVCVREEQMYARYGRSGYIFFLAQAMQEAAVSLGLEPEQAVLLVNQTILGSGLLLHESDQSAEALRLAVANPGGTTEAALNVMFERELPGIFADALTAARDRGIELNEGA